MPDISLSTLLNVPQLPPAPPPVTPLAGGPSSNSFDQHLQRVDTKPANDPPRKDDNHAPMTNSAGTNDAPKPVAANNSDNARSSSDKPHTNQEKSKDQSPSGDAKSPAAQTADDANAAPAEETPEDLAAAEVAAAAIVSQLVAAEKAAQASAKHAKPVAGEATTEGQSNTTAAAKVAAQDAATETAATQPVATTTAATAEPVTDILTNTADDKQKSKHKSAEHADKTVKAIAADPTAAKEVTAAPTVQSDATDATVTSSKTGPQDERGSKKAKSTGDIDVSALSPSTDNVTAAQANAAVAALTPTATETNSITDDETTQRTKIKVGDTPEVPSAGDAKNTPHTTTATTNKLNHGTLEKMSADKGNGPTGLSDVDRVRFIQRVARAFQTATDTGGEMKLRLSPPELGSLRLEVQVQDGVLSAKLQTETDSTRNLLLENLPQLKERLQEHNIQVGQFDVDLMDRSPGSPFDDNPGDNQSNSRNNNRRGPAAPKTVEAVTGANSRSVTGPGGGQLNIVI